MAVLSSIAGTLLSAVLTAASGVIIAVGIPLVVNVGVRLLARMKVRQQRGEMGGALIMPLLFGAAIVALKDFVLGLFLATIASDSLIDKVAAPFASLWFWIPNSIIAVLILVYCLTSF